MSDPSMIKRNPSRDHDTPVMAKARIRRFVECQILQTIGVDSISTKTKSSHLPTIHSFHLDKTKFKIPFVCGCRNLSEASRRISEAAAIIRTKGESRYWGRG
jgi:pyridoxal 5'-phosphate synthase pdxS subunit